MVSKYRGSTVSIVTVGALLAVGERPPIDRELAREAALHRQRCWRR